MSAAIALRFAVKEFVLLRLARWRHAKEYDSKKDNPLVSVYIPTYNRADMLKERSIPTVLAQTYKNFELIIIGDHCTDNTEKVVNSFNDQRIRFYNIPKRGYRYPPTSENHWFAGAVVASNVALQMVRGKWIAVLDDDDIWTPDHLEELLRFAQSGGYEFVSSAWKNLNEGNTVTLEARHVDAQYYHPGKVGDGVGPRIGSDCTWVYRSYLTFFKYNINCWRKSWNKVNDIDILLRIARAGVKIGYLNKPLASVLPRPGETTTGSSAYTKSEKETLEFYKFE